ncbi:MAG TPA: phosphatidylglycerophosphatase A [Acidimicrobiia bacterium]
MKTALASWFGTGLILGRLRGSHSGSGTVGSMFAFPVAVWIGQFGIGYQLVATIVVTLVALWSIGSLVGSEGDAGWIVIDEAAGMFLAVIGLSWGPALVAFFVFRLADIYKKRFPGVARAEDLSGAVGVVADDLIAGAYGLVAGLLASRLIG